MHEELRWKKYNVLNDGFICLVDVMGDDSAIVQAARVSYGKDERQGNTGTEGYCEALSKHYGNKVSDILIDYIKGNTTIVFESDLIQNIVIYHNSDREEVEKLQQICHDGMENYHNKDRQLIRYLLNHSHTTPFEMVEFKFLVRVPMDCWRQWIRHRTANVNEFSTRYSEAIDSQQTTSPEEWRLQAKNNKQGSSGFLEEWPEGFDKKFGENGAESDIWTYGTPGEALSSQEDYFIGQAKEIYQRRLSLGIAREQARKDLPLSTYTEAYWKCDLHNIFNFLRLRLDSHAQLEIRLYAQAMYEIVKQICPIACEAFEDYVLNARKFSRMEMENICGYFNAWREDREMSKPDNMTDNEWKKFLEKLS